MKETDEVKTSFPLNLDSLELLESSRHIIDDPAWCQASLYFYLHIKNKNLEKFQPEAQEKNSMRNWSWYGIRYYSYLIMNAVYSNYFLHHDIWNAVISAS